MRLWQKLEKLKTDGPYPFHMPGHKRNFSEMTGSEIDITEIAGFDNLHNSDGVLLEERKRAARIFGSQESFLLVNGSSCGILTAISATVPFGGRVLMQKDSHKSVYNGVRLRNADMVYITQDTNPKVQVEKLLEDNKIDLVIVTSPNYIGETLDIVTLADICHKNGVPLLVDAAHGAHFKFCDSFPMDAISAGADLVVNSLHKTLPALTSTALLHVSSDLVDINQVKYFTQVYQTSSPSYILMSSISRCLQFLEENQRDFESYVNRLECFYEKVKSLRNLRVRQLSFQERQSTDIGKIVIYPPEWFTGIDISNYLRKDYSLELEMATEDYALAMTSVCDAENAYDLLAKALLDIDNKISQLDKNSGDENSKQEVSTNIMKLVGTVAKMDLVPYPPGVPMVLAGETITEEKAVAMEKILLAGGQIEGIK